MGGATRPPPSPAAAADRGAAYVARVTPRPRLTRCRQHARGQNVRRVGRVGRWAGGGASAGSPPRHPSRGIRGRRPFVRRAVRQRMGARPARAVRSRYERTAARAAARADLLHARATGAERCRGRRGAAGQVCHVELCAAGQRLTHLYFGKCSITLFRAPREVHWDWQRHTTRKRHESVQPRSGDKPVVGHTRNLAIWKGKSDLRRFRSTPITTHTDMVWWSLWRVAVHESTHGMSPQSIFSTRDILTVQNSQSTLCLKLAMANEDWRCSF